MNLNNRSKRSELEKHLLKMMIDYDIDQTDLARFEGVSPQAINNRLKRLNEEKVEELEQLIRKIANNSQASNGSGDGES